MHDGFVNRDYIEEHCFNLYNYIITNGWYGYDPYDGLNCKIASLSKNKLFSICLIQFNKTSPINFRRVLRIKKGIDIKGMGLLARSLLKLYKSTGNDKFLKDARFCLEFLKMNSLKADYGNYCWSGHYFRFQSINSRLAPNIPDIISTVVCALAFLEDYEVTNSKVSLDIARSSSDFIINKLYRENVGPYFKYTPVSDPRIVVYNASTHGAMLLSKINEYINNDDYVNISRNVFDYIISKQKENGMWFYSETEDRERMQIDFHQGFILDSLFDFMKHTDLAQNKYRRSLMAGAEFYKNMQFLPNGRCKYRWPRTYPIDIHNQAQGVITFSKLGEINDEYLIFAEKIAEWTITHMQDKKGYFYYQKWPLITNKIPYMRWSQAWMMLAFTTLLEAFWK